MAFFREASSRFPSKINHAHNCSNLIVCTCSRMLVAINQMLFVKGLTLTSTIHAALLILVTPIVVTLFALWVLNERFTLFKAMGLSLGIGGAVNRREGRLVGDAKGAPGGEVGEVSRAKALAGLAENGAIPDQRDKEIDSRGAGLHRV